MILIKINDIKDTMSHLLIKESFDQFYVEEAEAVTYAKMNIRGKRNKEWYDDDEMEQNGAEWLYWREIKNVLFEYIKGKKTPAIFKVSLKADDSMAKAMLGDSGYYNQYVKMHPNLFMQIRFEHNELSVVTGISYSEFTMDKKLEAAWDDAVQKWIRKLGVSLEINN